MFRHTQLTPKASRLSGMFVVVAAVAVLLTSASQAQAGNRNPKVVVSVGFNHGAACRPAPCAPISCKPTRSFADLEFERGLDRGKCIGFEAGYQDGLCGTRFCNRPVGSLCNVSTFYRQGYLDGFARAYSDGFEKGRCERERLERERCERELRSQRHRFDTHIHGRWARR